MYAVPVTFARPKRKRATVNDKPSLTIQSQAKDADINEIVRRFGVTGVWHMPEKLPTSADFGGIFDFQSAQAVLLRAKEMFMQLDADTRLRFRNDPFYFADFAADSKNIEELRRLGLAPAKVAEKQPVPNSPEPASK